MNEVVSMWRIAAEKGNASARLMYDQGQGSEKDYGEAVRLNQKAADQGLALGKGVKQNFGEAARWFCKAATQGDEAGKEIRASTVRISSKAIANSHRRPVFDFKYLRQLQCRGGGGGVTLYTPE
jgi:TPR repeat protein